MLADDADPRVVAEKLIHPQFPRSATYDPVWQGRYADGPNPLWLAESLTEQLDLTPGMRVLDLGCGWAISSIFLAKEFGVDVVAADMWMHPETWPLIVEAGMQSRVMPVRVEAHDLRFAREYFDVIISLDAYHYFGTDDLYLGYLQQFLAPDGVLGLVMLGVTEELDDRVPEHLGDTWARDHQAFHSPRWWRNHLNRSGWMTVEHADLVPDGWRHALRWQELAAVAAPPRYREACADWASRLAVDAGRTIGWPRIVARKTRKT
jgi:cyclopropane fatty-acyl-phospholipid synthase-like methyltransferase